MRRYIWIPGSTEPTIIDYDEPMPHVQLVAWKALWDTLPMAPELPSVRPMTHGELAESFNRLSDTAPDPDDVFDLPEDMQDEGEQ